MYFTLHECKKKLIKIFNWGEKKGYKKLDLCTGMIKMGINCINFWGRIYNFLYVLLHTSSNIIVRGPQVPRNILTDPIELDLFYVQETILKMVWV